MARSTPVAAVALCLGAGLGLFLGPMVRRGRAPEAAPPAAVSTAPAERPAPFSLEAARASASAPETRPPGPAGESGALAAAIAEIPFVEVARGKGSIAGHVRAADGQPLAGALVRATPAADADEAEPAGRAPDDDPTLESEVRDFVKRRRSAREARREALTDAAGAFAVTGLGATKYEVEARLAGLALRPVDGEASEVRPGATVDFVARTIVRIPALVYMPDGRLAERASIECKRSGHDDRYLLRRREIEAEPGSHQFTARGGDDGELRSEPQSVAVAADGAAPALTFRLVRHGGVRGKVSLPPDEQDEYLQAFILQFANGNVPDPARLRREGQSDWIYRRTRRYSFAPLSRGTYLVGVARPNEPPAVTQAIEVDDAMVTLDLTIPPPDRTDYVILTVLGPAGEVVDGAQVGSELRGNHGTQNDQIVAIEKAGGTYWVAIPDAAKKAWRGRGDAETRLVLTVTADEFGSRTVEVAPGETTALVRFLPPATLDVTIAGYAGSGLEGALVLSLEKPGGDDEEGHGGFYFSGGNRYIRRGHSYRRLGEEESLDAEGHQKLGPVEPGTYELMLGLQPEGGGNQPLTAERATLTLVPGRNEHVLSAPALYALRVVVDRAGGGIALNPAGRGSGRWICKVADADGRCVFDRLPAGSYQLRFFEGDEDARSFPSEASMAVTVPGPAEVRYSPARQNALLVTVTDPNGRFAQAGLASGDFITAVNGAEFEGAKEFAKLLLAASQAKEMVQLTVLRGAETLTVPIDPEPMVLGDVGGGTEPAARPR